MKNNKEYQKKYREEHSAEIAASKKVWVENNKEHVAAKKKEWYNNNKDRIAAEKHKKYEENKESILAKNKEYRDANKEKTRETHKKYQEEHKEEIAKKKHEYYIENKEIFQQYRAERSEHFKDIQKKRYQSLAEYDKFYEKFSPYYSENEIRRDPDNPELIQFRCKYDGKWFNPTVLQLKNRYNAILGIGSNGGKELYCSKACKRACPIYNKNKWPAGFKDNTSREVQPELRKMVLERDNWTCQKCGKSKEDFPELELHCHHIFPLNENPVESADIDNCITYCKECHKWIHKNVPGCGYAEMKCSEDTDAA